MLNYSKAIKMLARLRMAHLSFTDSYRKRIYLQTVCLAMSTVWLSISACPFLLIPLKIIGVSNPKL
jgi:hypothetical protein